MVRNSYIELYINGKSVEFESQKDISIRINDVLFNPTKIETTQATYSFEFELPCTPTNNKIFDYANNLSRLNKFHKRWDAELYADGNLIFSGSLALKGVEEGYYQCNLVNFKTNSIEEIFEDDTLYDIPWYMDFSGATTINECNADKTSKVVFPLVSYGVFEKEPSYKDDVAAEYTSKYKLDKWNQWYIETFYPSINAVELIKRAFEWKGYQVQGDLLNDETLGELFMSCNLADGQDPTYPLGMDKFGKLSLHVDWRNKMDYKDGDSGFTFGTIQELRHPYQLMNNPDATEAPEWSSEWSLVKLGENENLVSTDPIYNFTKVRIYDMLSEDDNESGYTINEPSYLFNPNEHCVFVPADGFYKIKLEYRIRLEQSSSITATQWVRYYNMFNGYNASFGAQQEDIELPPDLKTTMPVEIQLVRNYDEDLELIKGNRNFMCIDGFPNHNTVSNLGYAPNWFAYTTAFPHESWGTQMNNVTFPYNANDCKLNPWANFHLEKYVTKWDYPNDPKSENFGYYSKPNDTFCYDPAVSPIFLIGGTSMGNNDGGGVNAVIKNGYSWSKSVSEQYYNFYNNGGYGSLFFYGGSDYNSAFRYTDLNANTLIDSPQNKYYMSNNGKEFSGVCHCIVKLEKNDKLNLFAVHRDFENKNGDTLSYQSSGWCNIMIEAVSPNSYNDLKNRGFGWNSTKEFDTRLRVSNFLNKETKVSDWFNSFITAFNLEVAQNGNIVSIGKRKKLVSKSAVDLDDRVATSAIKSQMIEYPKSMAIKYKIDEDEHGFYDSVPLDKVEQEDWKNYGDKGYDTIQLSDDDYVTNKEEKQLNFSYTWYDDFEWTPIGKNHDDSGDYGDSKMLRIPVISKEEYMIDGYDYAESMKHDGYGLTQRFWFRPTIDDMQSPWIWTDTYPQEKIWLYTTQNSYNGLVLNYKLSENSILKTFFNIDADLSSNFIEIETYLTPMEYNMLKNGALVRVDKDVYKVSEIEGYSPNNNDLTTLKLIKKV